MVSYLSVGMGCALDVRIDYEVFVLKIYVFVPLLMRLLLTA